MAQLDAKTRELADARSVGSALNYLDPITVAIEVRVLRDERNLLAFYGFTEISQPRHRPRDLSGRSEAV